MAETTNQLTPERFKELLMTVLWEAKGLPQWMQEDGKIVDKQNRGWVECREEVSNEEKT